MVILLCSTPRRGMVAIATHGTPSGYTTENSKRALAFAPSSPVGGPFLHPGFKQCHLSRDSSPTDTLLEKRLKRGSNTDGVESIGYRDSDSERSTSSFVGHRSRSPTISKKMTATPTYGNSCFPFAVNCRFSKTFFGVPKKCGYCQRIIVGTGFACQNCRFRCHKKCIMIGRGPQVCLRPKPCSLSRLPPGDEALINKLLKEHEINSNDIDSVFVESELEDEDADNDAVSEALTGASSRRPSRPSLANSSSFVGGVRSIAPSLTTSDEPSSSPPPSPPSVSLSASNPSSPTYPSSVVTDCSTASRYLHPPQRQRQQQCVRRDQQQRNTNMLLLALAAGVERRPSSSSTTSSSRRPQQAAPANTPNQTPTSGASFMDRFLKLFPSWTSGTKEEAEQTPDAANDNTKTTARSCSIISADSSTSVATHSAVSESYDKETKYYLLPRAVSASDAASSMTKSKRPHTLSACSTTSQTAYSGASSVRTPVDEFNSSVLEDLFSASQAAGVTNTSASCSSAKPSQFLRRKLLWAKHIAGDRSARSQDCVISGGVIIDAGPASTSGLGAIRGRSATLRPGSSSRRAGRDGSTITSNGQFANRQSTFTIDGGRVGIDSLERGVTESDEAVESSAARERLANTWPLSGLHINHDERSGERTDDMGGTYLEVPEDFEASDGQECGADEDLSDEMRQRQARLSDLGEWTIAYSDLQFGECVHECRDMTTYKGRWHGDVMIHTVDMSGAESDRLMRSFLDDVRTLTKIRHENVALFMGASIEAPLVAVVTSIRKGCSLYDAVHVENQRISQHAKLNIVRQVAQGMGYLHAKGIVLKTLTSKSIYLECKVKISTLDDGAPLKRHDTFGTGCVRRGHLTYISPELMQTLRVAPPALIVDGIPTKESDVYSFGTILFELYAGDFPFAQMAPEAVVWTIGTGRRQDLERVRCNVAMKSLIEDCWSPDPAYRPSFTEVLKELQRTAALHKKHSSSVPEKLNKTGLHRSLYNY